MTEKSRALRILVFGYESLEGNERRRVNQHLAVDFDARNLLLELQALERAATDPVPTDGSWPEATLSFVERAAERACCEELVATLD